MKQFRISLLICVVTLLASSLSCDTNVNPYAATTMDSQNSTLGFYMDGCGFEQSIQQYLGPPRTEVQSAMETINGVKTILIKTTIQSQDPLKPCETIYPLCIWLKIPYDDVCVGESFTIQTADSYLYISERYFENEGDTFQQERDRRIVPMTSMNVTIKGITAQRVMGIFEAQVKVDVQDGPEYMQLTNGVFNVKFTGEYNYEEWKKQLDSPRV